MIHATHTTAIPEASAGLARRTFLAGLAVTAPIAARAFTPALAASGAARGAIDALYEERTTLAAQSRELHQQYSAAQASMPWWAAPGPSHLKGDGTWRRGPDVGWPAIDDGLVPSRPNECLNKRPSASDIRKEFEGSRMWGEKHRAEFRARYRRQMIDLVSRLRRQRDEEAKAGLAAISTQLDAIGERLGEIDENIEGLDVSATDAAQKAAAVTLITSLYAHLRNNDEFGDTATLVALRPFLTGQIREHVDYVIEHPDHEMWAMPFYSAA
jgi:hypothetical protein